ncbi:MAG: hypothetical protein N2Z23_04070 [Pyrinomonadaceae bacterium]|nr:hypothetical protein [Pyrinomonadaceae bacterium]MCX7639605.1 hypothetical protein [Pyrinomonadaceae bacterium]MDW8303998.1 hypothetical protein [Acidobacteriota bacterium]
MKKQLLLIIILLNVKLAFTQQRPLITEDVDITPEGSFQVSIGTEFLQNYKFSLSGLKGDLTKVGFVTTRIGLAPNVEIQIEGTIRNFLAINSYQTPSPIPLDINRNSTSDTGDFTISTKIKLNRETAKVPAFGFKFGVQLPNSNQAKGIGTNQINTFGKLLFQKKFGKRKESPDFNLFGNIGIGIFTAPLERFTQNDLLLYGLAGVVRISKNANLVMEINGRSNTRNNVPLGTENLSEIRIGTQITVSKVRFDTAGIFGLTRYSPRTGVYFGVTYQSPKVFTASK